MAVCYLCAVHDAPSRDRTAVASCTRCDIFTCLWDGARVHRTGEFLCAVCMVPTLLASAGVDMSPGPAGPGGGRATGALADVEARAFLGTDDFERQCKELADATAAARFEWRGWIESQWSPALATRLGAKLQGLVGTVPDLDVRLNQAAGGNLDKGLVADALGVGEHAARAEKRGPESLGLAYEELRLEPVDEERLDDVIGTHEHAAALKKQQQRADDQEQQKYMTS